MSSTLVLKLGSPAHLINHPLITFGYPGTLRLRDTRARAVRNVLGNLYLSSLTKNLWNEEREQLHSGSGGALSQGAGHDGSFF